MGDSLGVFVGTCFGVWGPEWGPIILITRILLILIKGGRAGSKPLTARTGSLEPELR
jgi:hypothetical protein